MNTPTPQWLRQNRIFAWLALATGLLLLIPLLLQWIIGTGVDGQGFNWRLGDFIVMGLLLFGVGTIAIVAARKTTRAHWWLIGTAATLTLLYVWAELAVGILTPFGS